MTRRRGGTHSASPRRSASKVKRSRRRVGLFHLAHPVRTALIGVIIVLVIGFALSRFIEIPGLVDTGTQITVTIPDGAGANQVGTLLKENKVISSSRAFSDRISELGESSDIKPGTYILTGGASLDTIIEMLVKGETGHKLTIPEGFTLKQIAARVYKVTGISSDTFYKLSMKASSYAAQYTFLEGVYNDSMEGFLYPSTYEIPYDATADDVIKLMLDAFKTEVLPVDLTYAKSKNLTLFDVITLASMVEKESRRDSDRAQVASVFYNRLKKGMNLGSDVTTYYAVGKELTEELTAKDLASDSPYNTRNPKHKGLPAGPICNPGLASIKAAAQPAQTDYLYFFYSASQDKTMFFADDKSFSTAWKKYGD